MNGTYNSTMKNNKGKLLLADAKSGLREAMTRNLQKAGYGVLQARDAHEALRLLGTQAVETLFVDEDLPGLPLVELAKKNNIIVLFAEMEQVKTLLHPPTPYEDYDPDREAVVAAYDHTRTYKIMRFKKFWKIKAVKLELEEVK